jgi:hypothetical protein
MMQRQKVQPVPGCWTLLSNEDKFQYRQLCKVIEPLTFRTSRDQLSMKLQVIVNHIRNYSIRNDADDWKRCLICGIAWLDDATAISTRQPRFLIGKCKSSINSGFQSLGYSILPMSSEHASKLTAIFPFLAHHCGDVRQ